MRSAFASLLFVALGTTAHGQSDTFGGAYLCMQDFGGGLAWSDTTKKWSGTVFNATGKFVLRLSEPSSRMEKNYAGVEEQVTDYKVTVTGMGETYAAPCSPVKGQFGAANKVGPMGWIYCSASLTDYSINLASMRFLESYMVGFVGGADNNENTPSMFGGTCAKIE